jgi:DNA polymerase V
MSFDARSLERLKQLGRTLPQPLAAPEPPGPGAPSGDAKSAERRHRVETETDPAALFRELMKVSPDGEVPPHLLDRLRQAEGESLRASPASGASADSATATAGAGATRRSSGARPPDAPTAGAAMPPATRSRSSTPPSSSCCWKATTRPETTLSTPVLWRAPTAVRAACSVPPIPPTDLNTLLIPHPRRTFLLRVSGESMIGAGIHPGDLLIVDRHMEPRSGRVVVAELEGAFTLKRLVRRRGGWWLEACHPAYPPLPLGSTEGAGPVRIWGVAIHAIRSL